MSNNPIFVSIIIPLYNKRESIHTTLDSVIKQTFSHFEIIVIDDGSTDDGFAIVSKIKDDRIRLLRKPNGGVSSARNRGIHESQYDLIAFLDADDLWEPNYLEEMISLVQEFPQANMYGCYGVLLEDKERRNSVRVLPAGFRGYVDNYFTLACTDWLYNSSATIVRKAALEKIGKFDERITIGEDFDFWFRVALHSRISFMGLPLMTYNLDGPNRAMKRKREFKNDISCYLHSFKKYETSNSTFRYFINHFRLQRVPIVFLGFGISDNEKITFVATINGRGQHFKHRVFLLMPFWFQKRIIELLYSANFK